MKLKYKALAMIGSCYLCLLGLILISSIHQSPLGLVSIFLIFTSITFFLIYLFIIKRIIKLNTFIANINGLNNLSNRIKIKGNDDISTIVNHINVMLDMIELSQDQFIIHEKERQKELQCAIEKHAQQKYLSTISHYDQNTALPNRIFFNEILNKSINHAKRRNKVLAILLIDIKSSTNELLQKIASKFESILRSEDILAKLDGGEFIILLTDMIKPKFASTVAEKLLRCCNECSVSASIGICIYPHDGHSLEEILNHLNLALYSAKHHAKNGYQFYAPAMNTEAHEYMQLETSLRNAMKQHELILYYQPKLSIKQGRMIGVEALTRWERPDLGIITPHTFLPIAEETGIIFEIGEFTLFEACKTNKCWQDEGYEHLTVALNLSAKQFYHREIINTIKQVLADTHLNPRYLEIEISENTVMHDVQIASSILNEMKAIGMQIAIDHFGRGYTSISQLKQLPISILKIDQSFIKGIPINSNDMAITNAIIALAHHLGMVVVAAGVETAEQVKYLTAQECDIIQGYFLSHPLPADKIVLQFKKITEHTIC